MQPELHPDVKTAIRAWADAGELERSAEVLTGARRDLDPALLPQLRSKIAEISAECCVELLALERDVVPGKPIEVMGMALMPKQAERFVAWAADQKATGMALGVGPQAWGRMVEAGMRRYVSAERSRTDRRQSVRDWSRRAAEAEQLLGTAAAQALDVPKPRSASSGLMGMIAARTFKS